MNSQPNKNKEEIQNNEIIKEIIKVLAFFNMFDHPLAWPELWRFLSVSCSLDKLKDILDNRYNLYAPPSLLDRIDEKNGFYFLAGREKIFETRRRRYNYSDRKFKRAIKISKLFRLIPWIKMIAIGNIIGTDNLKNKGDIDFFIITRANRLWITRFFCVVITILLRLRPRPGKEQDTVCLSFYLSENNLDLSKYILEADDKITEINFNSIMSKDPYFVYWLACLAPIYDEDNIYEKLIAENSWLRSILPNWEPILMPARRRIKRMAPNLFYELIELFTGGLEINLRKWQPKKMPKIMKALLKKNDNRVLADDKIIKLHVNDRRQEYRLRLKNKLAKLI